MKKIYFLLATVLPAIISNAQNVGIGILTPQTKLHLSSGLVYTGLSITSDAAGNTFNDGLHLGLQYQADAIGNRYGYFMLHENIPLLIGTNTLERMRISADGNIGIGYGNPLARLEVKGSGTTSVTSNFIIRNSINDTIMRVRDDGRVGIGYNGAAYGRVLNLGGTGVNFYTSNEAAFGGAVFPTDTSLVIWSNSNANNYVVLQPSWGNTGIGTYTPNAKLHLNGSMLIGNNSARTAVGYMLSVDGKIICEELKVQLSGSWPDYVFENDYPLLSLDQLQQQVMNQKHLPGVPSAKEVEAGKGVEMGDMQKRLLEKVEELYRYVFELNTENKALREELKEVKKKIK